MPAKKRAPATPARPDALLLLDGHSLAYRAFYALPPELATKSGQPTNAVYGFTSMLIKLLGDYGTERVGVAFDVGRPTIRLAEYADYKAGRKETPDAFRSQLALLREVLAVLEIPVFGVPDHEADDVLATLARCAEEAGIEAIIVTADRDALQLVRPGVSVLFNRRGVSDIVMYDRDAVTERFGIPPERYVEYAAIKGDPSDNLPSVPGIGEKTASRLIAEHGSIEGVYENLDSLPPKTAAALREARDNVFRNKRLALLIDDLPLNVDPQSIRMGEWNLDRIFELFNSLEFRSLYERLEGVRRPPSTTADTFVARTTTDPEALLARVRETGRAGVAIPAGGDGIAVAAADGEAVWLATRGAAAAVLAAVPVVAHDVKALLRAGVDPATPWLDTMLAAYLLDP
ncbi:MAG: 5'-3' exonuclease H3TH domain-containing protein, partial [Actinomycetota bacterium]